MQTKPLDGYEPKGSNQAEKFSSFSEMLDLGWSLKHHRSNDTLIGADLNEGIDAAIERDNLSGAKLSDQNIQN